MFYKPVRVLELNSKLFYIDFNVRIKDFDIISTLLKLTYENVLKNTENIYKQCHQHVNLFSSKSDLKIKPLQKFFEK